MTDPAEDSYQDDFEDTMDGDEGESTKEGTADAAAPAERAGEHQDGCETQPSDGVASDGAGGDAGEGKEGGGGGTNEAGDKLVEVLEGGGDEGENAAEDSYQDDTFEASVDQPDEAAQAEAAQDSTAEEKGGDEDGKEKGGEEDGQEAEASAVDTEQGNGADKTGDNGTKEGGEDKAPIEGSDEEEDSDSDSDSEARASKPAIDTNESENLNETNSTLNATIEPATPTLERVSSTGAPDSPKSPRSDSSPSLARVAGSVSTARRSLTRLQGAARPASPISPQRERMGSTDSMQRSPSKAEIFAVKHLGERRNSGGSHAMIQSLSIAMNEVWSFGKGDDGALGHGDKNSHDAPKGMAHLNEHQVVEISCGTHHCAAVTEEGHVYTWGRGSHGRLGHGDENARTRPRRVAGLKNAKVVSISCGAQRTLAVTDKHRVYAWGWGANGERGSSNEVELWEPRPIPQLDTLEVAAVEAGGTYALALTSDGQVYVWGYRDGPGKEIEDIYCKPHLMADLPLSMDISAGAQHCAVVTNDGELFTWGSSEYGQLGHGDHEDRWHPTKVQGIPMVEIVECGGYHTLTLAADGNVYAFGRGNNGQLGLGTNESVCVPSIIEEFKGSTVHLLSAGLWHSAAVVGDDNVFVWGRGEDGQLGTGDTQKVSRPQQVERFTEKKVAAVSCGGWHTVVFALDYDVK